MRDPFGIGGFQEEKAPREQIVEKGKKIYKKLRKIVNYFPNFLT